MTYSQLVSDCKFWVAGDSTATVGFTTADINTSLNEYYNEIVSIIMKCDGRFEWDDNNLTTLPIAVTDLVSGQGDYEIDAMDFLNIIRVEIKDSSGNWITLTPMSYEDKQGTAINDLDETQGTPTMYDKVGNSLIFHTIPNYASTGGLKVYFQRTPDYFTVDDTTQTPGFNPLYHRYLSMGAALDYCLINSITDRVQVLTAKMTDMKQRIMDDYSKRSKDEHLHMSTYRESYNPGDSYSNSSSKITW